MGAFGSKNRGGPQARIIMIGLDASGKTTMIYKMKLGEVVTTIPTIGFNVETVENRERNLTLTVWDVGGRDKIRPLWRHYYAGTNALIFMIDCDDRDRLMDAKEEMFKMLNEDLLEGATLLVMANKQDLPNAMSASEIREALHLDFLRNRHWHIRGCCATTGDGLNEGMDWLLETVTNPPESFPEPDIALLRFPGPYTVDSITSVFASPEDGPYRHQIGSVPQDTSIEVLEVHDNRPQGGDVYGRIEEPAGWLSLAQCRRPALVVALHELETEGRTELVGRSLAGTELIRLPLQERQTVAELMATMVTQLSVERKALRVVSADGRLVSDLDDTTLLCVALRP